MLPNFLVPESIVREDGTGLVLTLDKSQGCPILLSLGITRIIEQESLDLLIWGSVDGEDWGKKPLLSFPQKFYCGTYQMLLDLSKFPDVRFLRAQWKLNRWGRGEGKPMFSFYLFVSQPVAQTAAAARSA